MRLYGKIRIVSIILIAIAIVIGCTSEVTYVGVDLVMTFGGHDVSYIGGVLIIGIMMFIYSLLLQETQE